MTTRMLTSTFGSTLYDTGVIPANAGTTGAETVEFLTASNPYGSRVHDDVFYEFSVGNVVNGQYFITYDQHDLRDLLQEGKAMENAMINVQRMKETPVVVQCFNLAPTQAIFETIIVTNSALDMDVGNLGTNFQSLFQAGYGTNFPNRNNGKLDSPDEILYCERRIYSQDRGQEFTSPDEMGSMFGGPRPPGNNSETRWTNQFLLMDRTVSGQANMVIGPNLQIIRMVQVGYADRGVQAVSTTEPLLSEIAQEYEFQTSRCYITMPALTVNVIGEMKEMTATQKAVEYTNVFLSNQNLP